MGDLKLDEKVFGARLKQLLDHWGDNKESLWGGAAVLGIATGAAANDDIRYMKSISLQFWMLGYELPDTLLVITPTKLHMVASSKKAALLKELEASCKEVAGLDMQILVKPKGEDGVKQMAEVLSAVKAEVGTGAVVASLKDKHTGPFFEAWGGQVAASGLQSADMAPAVSHLLAVKTPEEQQRVKKAGFLAGKVMQTTIKQIESYVDEEKKVKHSQVAEMAEDRILNPMKAEVKLRAENCDIAYQPMIQSGGAFDIRYGVPSEETRLHNSGTFLCCMGAKYLQYCANMARTMFVDPSSKQEQEYAALAAAQKAGIAALKQGARLSKVYEAVVNTLNSMGQKEMAEKLGKNVGFGLGLELKDSKMLITKNSEVEVRPGMVVCVSVGVSGLKDSSIEDSRSRSYAMQLADTVIVRKAGDGTGQPDMCTAQFCNPDWNNIANYLNEEAAEAAEEAADLAEGLDKENGMLSGKRLRGDDPNNYNAEEERRRKQEDMVERKNEETYRRLTEQKERLSGANTGGSVMKLSELKAYSSIQEFPPGATRDLVIQVDERRQAVLLPIYGVMVPFHIMTIKSASCNQDSDHALVRINFNYMGQYEPATKFPGAIFLKELSFRSSDPRRATNAVHQISALRRSVINTFKEKAERATLVKQEKLVKGKRVYRLPDVWVRPTFGGKGRKVTGILEAHSNGFRYSNPKGEELDVMYRNIKHAFFQPADGEMITLVHFHLENPIMVGKKKTKDVQFYTEVMDVVQTLDAGRRAAYDPDEIDDEQRERDRRNKINQEFQQFVKKVQDLWEREHGQLGLEFEVPFRDLGFYGVPSRSTCFLMPTNNALVELIEQPFTVVTLDEIEIVNLERVGMHLKNFDMAIVFKDYSREVLRVDAIPSSSQDTVKDWLTTSQLKYYENKLNLSWKQVLKAIMEDPEAFINDGGWEFLNMERSDEEGEDEDEASEEFKPESSDDDGSDDDDDSDAESLVESDQGDDEEGSDDDEDEEEGKDWDQLEDEARRADKAREGLSDDEEERPRKRRR